MVEPTIKKFDEVNGLIAAWNAADEGTITKDQDDGVVQIVASEGAGTLLPDDGFFVVHGAATIGISGLLAFDTVANTQRRYIYTDPGDPLPANTHRTVFVLESRYSTNSGRSSWEWLRSGSTTKEGQVTRSGADYSAKMNTADAAFGAVVADQPNLWMWSYGGGTSGAVRLNGAETPISPDTNANTLGGMSFFNDMYGRVSLMVVYDRELLAEEIQDVEELITYWLDTGHGPAAGGTSTSFGPVLTVDTSATLKWQWSSDQGAWYDVDDGVNPLDPSIQWSLSDVGQTGNQLNILSATAAQVVYLRCKATTNYEPGGIFSNVNTLTIVEAT